jgi:hypothetical protein
MGGILSPRSRKGPATGRVSVAKQMETRLAELRYEGYATPVVFGKCTETIEKKRNRQE